MPQQQAATRRLALATFAISSIALFMTALDNLVVITALPVIKESLGASLSHLEWTVNAYTLTFAVLLLTGAALGDRFGRKRMFIIGVALFTGASAFAALAPTVEYLAMVPAFIISGIGMALFFAPTANLVLSAVRPEEEGRASGVNNTIREIGGVFGVAVLASVFSANGGYASPQAFVDGMVPAVWVGAAVLAVAAIAATFVPGRSSVRSTVHLPVVPELGTRLAPAPIAVRAED